MAISRNMLEWGRYGNREKANLIITVQFKVFFRFQCVGIWVLRCSLNAFRNVSEDLLNTEHPIGIQARIAIWSGDTWQKVLPWLQNERNFYRFLERDLVLLVHQFSFWGWYLAVGRTLKSTSPSHMGARSSMRLASSPTVATVPL